VAEQAGREAQVIAFLRNLSGGFSSYRLFGGNLEQPGFVEAVKRVKASAEPVLASGIARVRIHGDRFIIGETELPEDDTYKRLALACYERRVEEITLAAVPSTSDLASLYTVLTTTMDEIESSGGAPRMLFATGVKSIRLNEAIFTPAENPIVGEGSLLDVDPLDLGLDRLDDISKELLLDPQSSDASSVYRLLREVVSALPPERANDPDTYKRLREGVEKLPEDVRTAIASLLIADVGDDPVAERIIGTMTDTSLARMLVDVSRSVGGDPIELARELVVGGFRRHDLVDLASAATTAGIDGGAGRELPESIGGDRSNLLDAVGELVASDLRRHVHEDEQSILAEYPLTEQQRIEDALLTFSDYLKVEDDVDRLESVLESWAGAARLALTDDNAERAVRLVRVGDHAHKMLLDVSPERARLIAKAKRTILNEELIADIMEQGSPEETEALVRMFGDVAVNALLQRLATEEVGARRSMLIGVVASLISEHRSILRSWITDERWYVVRNLMTIIQRSGSASEMVEMIDFGVRHEHPAVRKEAARALAPAGPAALPRLVTLASDPDREVAVAAADALGSSALLTAQGAVATIGRVVRTARDGDVRERALQLLSEHPSAEATEVLAAIGRFGSKPRAPFSIRRKARALARKRRGQ
jgi:HEAT repeats